MSTESSSTYSPPVNSDSSADVRGMKPSEGRATDRWGYWAEEPEGGERDSAEEMRKEEEGKREEREDAEEEGEELPNISGDG